MDNILFRKIKRASTKYIEYLSACDEVAIEAQKHIDWNIMLDVNFIQVTEYA